MDERVNVHEYKDILTNGTNHLLIDVRPEIQYGICSLPNSVHIPIDELDKRMNQVKQAMTEKKVTSDNGINDL